MVEMITLVCPEGAYDYYISHGTQHFAPYRANHLDDSGRENGPWLVDVPADIAHHFMRAGFTTVKEQEMTPEGMTKVRKVDGSDHGWEDRPTEKDGSVMVPTQDAAALVESHGFEIVPEKPARKMSPIPAKKAEEDEVRPLLLDHDEEPAKQPESDLRAQAEALGIDVDGRWGDARLQEEIDKALEK